MLQGVPLVAPQMPRGSILLLDRVTCIAAGFVADWVAFPAEYSAADLVTVYHTVEAAGGTVGVELQSTYDRDAVVQVLAPSMVSTPQVVTQQAKSKLARWVRVSIGSTAAALTATVSVWLVPKRE